MKELYQLVKANPGNTGYNLLKGNGLCKATCKRAWYLAYRLEEDGLISRRLNPDGTSWLLYEKGKEPEPAKPASISPYQLLSAIEELENPTIRMMCLHAFGVYNDSYSRAATMHLRALTIAGKVFHKLEDGEMRWYKMPDPLYQSKPKPVVAEVEKIEEVGSPEPTPEADDLAIEIAEAVQDVIKRSRKAENTALRTIVTRLEEVLEAIKSLIRE